MKGTTLKIEPELTAQAAALFAELVYVLLPLLFFLFVLLAPGENRHFEPGENSQFQPGGNRQSVPGGCSQPRFGCGF